MLLLWGWAELGTKRYTGSRDQPRGSWGRPGEEPWSQTPTLARNNSSRDWEHWEGAQKSTQKFKVYLLPDMPK